MVNDEPKVDAQRVIPSSARDLSHPFEMTQSLTSAPSGVDRWFVRYDNTVVYMILARGLTHVVNL